MTRSATPSPRQRWCVAALSLALAGPVLSADLFVTAKYTPSSLTNEFENTTQHSGHCAIYPQVCGGQTLSFDLPIRYEKEAVVGQGPEADRWGLQTPAARVLTVVSDKGDVEHLDLSFVYVNQMILNGGSGLPLGTSGRVLGGCTYSAGEFSEDFSDIMFVWKISNPQSPERCYEPTTEDPTELRRGIVHEFSAAYRLTTPNPLRMKAGTYRGSTTYTVGESGDFALGPRVTNLNTSAVTLDFELEVQHALALEFPANSERLVLEPPGSWEAWLGGGPAPAKLIREVPFRITNSGPLGIYMTCEHEVAGSCAIANERNGEQAPLNVLLTLPDLITESGLPVRKRSIPVGEAAAIELDVVTPAVNQSGSLLFETAPGVTVDMVKNAGDRYVGTVTVVFDAEL